MSGDFERDPQDGFSAIFARADHEKDGQTIPAGTQGRLLDEFKPGLWRIEWQGTGEPLGYNKAEIDELTQAQALSIAERLRAARNRQAQQHRDQSRGQEQERER